MTIAMLALAGFPATAGFMGKFYLIDAAVAGQYTWLGVMIVVGSMISLGYYLRVVAVMWMSPTGVELPTRPPRFVKAVSGWSQEADARAQPEVLLVAALAAAATIVFGIVPEPLFNVARDVGMALGHLLELPVNLFIVACGDGPPVAGMLASLVERLPFFPGRPVDSWSGSGCSAAWVTHEGTNYVAAEPERLAMYSGRPILWTGDTEADGRAPIDPRFYFDGALPSLDGRFVAVRIARGAVEVVSDPLGAYPVYTASVDGRRLVSNSAELLRFGASMRPDTLASLLGGGWSLDGHPLWEGVERLAPGMLHRFSAEGGVESERIFPAAPAPGTGFDAGRAATVAVASIRALADWPGRPSVVPVTGGRDSRLVLGAALAAGISFETTTGGEPGHPDVEVGRALAAVAGVPHRILEHDPHGSVITDWRRAAELLSLTTSGTSSLSDAAGFPFGPRPGPLVLWHSGQGGEVARSYYGLGGGDRDALADRLYRAFVARRPGRTELLGADGDRLVRRQLTAFVEEQLGAGVQPVDVPDMFYLQRRMGTWAGPSHGAVEYVRDTTSPLWSQRLLRDELGLSARDRARELFHLRMLEQLAPELVDVPFEDGRPWPALEGDLARRLQRARVLARKVRGELRRRVRARPAPQDDPFARVLPEIRDAVLSQPGHPAWHVLDAGRVRSLLNAEPAALDTMSRYYAWRLATVFGPSA